MDNTYTFYWKDGRRSVGIGRTENDAFLRAGYSAFAMFNVQMTREGDDQNYVWNAADRQWEKKVVFSN